jgi:tetratricopeptide (TPR) repeat protein
VKIRLHFVLFALLLSAWTACGQDTVASEKFSVWLPGLPWALEFDAQGFTPKANEIQKDGRRYFFAENSKTHVIVSVFLEAVKGPVQPDECKRSLEEKVKRNSSFSDSPLKGVAYRQIGDMQVLEYKMSEVDGVPANQENVFGCIRKEDAFVDIHISKVFFREADRPVLDALLSSFRSAPGEGSIASAPMGNSMQLFQAGSHYYVAGQFREAIPAYQKALDIEKITPLLGRTYWRVLVDNLGTAYGITGDLANAKSTFEYGVSKDPDYPLFYYNLACVAGEKSDAHDAEKFLKLAFDRRNNIIQGEIFPDARTDDSFQKLMLQDAFRQFANSIYIAGNSK